MSVRGYQLAIDWSRNQIWTNSNEDVTHWVEKQPDVVASWGRNDARATTDSVAGKLTFNLINTTRMFSPENTASALAGKVLPGTPVRFTATNPVDGGTAVLFRGKIDNLDVDANAAGHDVSMSCLDGWGTPNAITISTTVYQGQRTGALMHVILDAIGWPLADRSIDFGATYVPYWWLDGIDAATAVNDLVHSEGPPAIAYVKAGVFIFRDRHHRLVRTQSVNSQATFTHSIPPGRVVAATDTFTRTVGAGGWGVSDSGPAWSITQGTTSDFSMSSNVGRISLGTVAADHTVVLAVACIDSSVVATFTTPAIATGNAINGYLINRRVDNSNQYLARLMFDLSGSLKIGLEKLVAGVTTTVVAPVATGITYTTATGYRLEMQTVGSTVSARVSLVGAGIPDFQVSAMMADLPGVTSTVSTVGVRGILSGGNTNSLPIVLTVDNLTVTPLDLKTLKGSFGYDHGLNNIVNSATLEVTQRLPQDRQVVWSTSDPISLGASEVQMYTITSGDPFLDLQLPAQFATIGIDPEYTGDYTLAGGSVSFSVDRLSGASATLTITAGGGGAFLADGLRVRGTPLASGQTRRFSVTDQSSVNTFGANGWDGTAPWAYFYDADALSQKIVSTYAQARPTVTFDVADVNDQHLSHMLNAQISDRVTIRNDELGLSADYMVEQITHTVQQLGVVHRTTFGCQVPDPTQATNVFKFNTATPLVNGFDNGQFGIDGISNGVTMFTFDTTTPTVNGFDSGTFAA